VLADQKVLVETIELLQAQAVPLLINVEYTVVELVVQ